MNKKNNKFAHEQTKENQPHHLINIISISSIDRRASSLAKSLARFISALPALCKKLLSPCKHCFLPAT